MFCKVLNWLVNAAVLKRLILGHKHSRVDRQSQRQRKHYTNVKFSCRDVFGQRYKVDFVALPSCASLHFDFRILFSTILGIGLWCLQ